MNDFKEYVVSVGDSISQGINTVVFFAAITGSDSDESLSARAYRCQDNWFWGGFKVFINTIFFLQKNHCKGVYDRGIEKSIGTAKDSGYVLKKEFAVDKEKEVPDSNIGISAWVDRYLEFGNAWEMNPPAYVATLKEFGRDKAMKALKQQGVIHRIVKTYSDDVLWNVRFNNSDLSLDKNTHKRFARAAKKEFSKRNENVPTPIRNGMDDDGNFITESSSAKATKAPEGYVRKAGAGGGLSSWTWIRKDREPTAEEQQALIDFQTSIDKKS